MGILGPFLRPMEIAHFCFLMALRSHFGPFWALREPKYEILAQKWSLRKLWDIAILKLLTSVEFISDFKDIIHYYPEGWRAVNFQPRAHRAVCRAGVSFTFPFYRARGRARISQNLPRARDCAIARAVTPLQKKIFFLKKVKKSQKIFLTLKSVRKNQFLPCFGSQREKEES